MGACAATVSHSAAVPAQPNTPYVQQQSSKSMCRLLCPQVVSGQALPGVFTDIQLFPSFISNSELFCKTATAHWWHACTPQSPANPTMCIMHKPPPSLAIPDQSPAQQLCMQRARMKHATNCSFQHQRLDKPSSFRQEEAVSMA